jgi:hypothetical protein
MDDVLNRELFRRYAKNRPAKAALSSMGGILASSPELMQAANQYANGGMVGYAEGGAVDSGGFNMMDIGAHGRSFWDLGPWSGPDWRR